MSSSPPKRFCGADWLHVRLDCKIGPEHMCLDLSLVDPHSSGEETEGEGCGRAGKREQATEDQV